MHVRMCAWVRVSYACVCMRVVVYTTHQCLSNDDMVIPHPKLSNVGD